jgi:CMP-N-acetylneuraminic acid synthetase
MLVRFLLFFSAGSFFRHKYSPHTQATGRDLKSGRILLTIEEEIVGRYFKNRELDMVRWSETFPGQRSKVVAHIPVRAGSTRMKNKNIADVCGLPLLAYTVKVAQAAGADRVIVNTDSEKFAEIAKAHGAEVPFIRPKELANDTISPYYASFYAKRWLIDEEYPVDLFIDMYATNPFRNAETLRGYIKRAKTSGLLFTRACMRFNPEKTFVKGQSLTPSVNGESPRQFSFFKLVSSFMAIKMNWQEIKWNEYATMTNPIELVDVDRAGDLDLVRHIVRNNIYDFGVGI